MIDSFAQEARRFVLWASGEDSSIPMNPRLALVKIVALYQSGLNLPEPWTDAVSSEISETKYTLDDFNLVSKRAGELPFRSYSEVFDPFAEPIEEPIFGDVCVDIAEIYEDIVRGLRSYDEGNIPEARYKWGWSFQNHWGEHATAAIRALHTWLAQNSPDQLIDQA